MSFSMAEHPHRRLNILNGRWIICSPHRATRPWQGQVEKKTEEKSPIYDDKCYLCPTNQRATGPSNPDYKETYSFKNDFSALLEDSPSGEINEEELLCAKGTNGICRVICFSPNHSLTIALMPVPQIRKVVDEWIFQYGDLTQTYKYAQLFENKGAMMGCSNPHPHGQVWAADTIPEELQDEITSFLQFKEKKNCCLLCSYLSLELSKKVRIVAENKSFAVLVPFWAFWPFEVLVLPKSHKSLLSQLEEDEKDDLAQILKVITVKYDNIFETSFPYSMGIHQAPVEKEKDNSFFHFHFHFYPPLLRNATVKKFLVGYEMLADLCRDVPAETSAQMLREMSEIHYKEAQ